MAKSIKTSGESKPDTNSLLMGANKICHYLDDIKADEKLLDNIVIVIDTLLDDKKSSNSISYTYSSLCLSCLFKI